MPTSGILPEMVHLRRVARVFRETREQTGSLARASRLTGSFVLSKAPKLALRLRAGLRRREATRDIQQASRELAAGEVLLGIRVRGGLGDYLVIARFLRDLAQVAGDFAFDIFSTNEMQARWVFSSVPGFRAWHHEALFDHVFVDYDLAARISQFVVLHGDVARWRRLAAKPALVRAADQVIRFRSKIEPFIAHHPYLDGFLAQKAIYANRTRADFLHHMAGIAYGGDALPIACDASHPMLGSLVPGRYVTVHNGFDPEFFTGGRRATKCYPHFGAVVAQLRRRWPWLRFVQLGTRTSEAIPEVDLDLIGLTTLPQAAALLRGAALHLDNEGGLVHLARSLGTTSAVVFGPTPSAYFGYADNINLDPAFCGGCWWVNETWMSQCPRDFPSARCLDEQAPEAVVAMIIRHLGATLQHEFDIGRRDSAVTLAAAD